jgi:inosine-uridine nucleoside N-ribohydrolase
MVGNRQRRIGSFFNRIITMNHSNYGSAKESTVDRQSSAATIFVDTDMGCDDAIAVAWLLLQPAARVVGFSSVFGNSSVENATANLLTLLGALDVRLPVTTGAAQPLQATHANIGAFIHGPDGFWGAQQAQDLQAVPHDASAAIIAAARAHPGLNILALGPLTNIARALQADPAAFDGVRLVALGGARASGNTTPVAEFNIFADPHALEVVLASHLQVELVTYDAFEMLRVDAVDLAGRLAQAGGPGGQLLSHLLAAYRQASSLDLDAAGKLAVPDAVAAIYLLHPQLAQALPAAVRVITDGELTRGQTIIAISPMHQIAVALGASGMLHMAGQLSQPGFDTQMAMQQVMASLTQNARVVLRIDAPAMAELLTGGLLAPSQERSVGG